MEHQGIPLSSSFSSSSSRAALRLTLVLENVFVLALRGRDYKLLQFFGNSVICGTLNIQLIHRLISPHGRQTDAHRIFHSSSSIWPLPSFCDLDYVGAITNAITIIRTGSFALPTLYSIKYGNMEFMQFKSRAFKILTDSAIISQ